MQGNEYMKHLELQAKTNVITEKLSGTFTVSDKFPCHRISMHGYNYYAKTFD